MLIVVVLFMKWFLVGLEEVGLGEVVFKFEMDFDEEEVLIFVCSKLNVLEGVSGDVKGRIYFVG